MRFRIAICALAMLAVCSCGTRTVAGGNSTEADNALQGTVVDSLGCPQPGLVVVAMPSLSVDAGTLVSTVTDGSGAWSLRVGGHGTWRVEIRGNGRGLSQEMAVGTSRQGLMLHPLGSLAGVARTNAGASAEVAVRGTPRRLRPGSDGRWRFDSLPTGAAVGVCAFAGSDTVDLPPIQLVPGGLVTEPMPILMADAWVAESLQVAAVLADLRMGAARVRRTTLFDSLGFPVGLSLDSLGLDSLPSNLSFPSWVVELDLSENGIVGIPIPVRNLASLRKLSLSGNRGMDTSNLSGLTGLTSLSLSRGNMSFLPDVSKLTSLARLELDENAFTSLPASIWKLPSLVTLSARGNRIDSLPPVAALSTLRSLQLGWNRIRSLPSGWRNLGHLVEVGLQHDPLASLPDSLGYGWPRLRSLNLDTTGLATLPRTLATFDSDSLALSIRGNALCSDQGTVLESWLDKKFGSPWRPNQPQACP
jgi:hypothetical protein